MSMATKLLAFVRAATTQPAPFFQNAPRSLMKLRVDVSKKTKRAPGHPYDSLISERPGSKQSLPPMRTGPSTRGAGGEGGRGLSGLGRRR